MPDTTISPENVSDSSNSFWTLIKGGSLTLFDETTSFLHGISSSVPATTYGAEYAATSVGLSGAIQQQASQDVINYEMQQNQKISNIAGEIKKPFVWAAYVIPLALVVGGAVAIGYILYKVKT